MNGIEERTSLSSEWRMLFGENSSTIDKTKLQKYCYRGRLRDSRLRSTVWRVLLRVLPMDRAEWIQLLNRDRQNYNELRDQLDTDPRTSKYSETDPNINNPLSLDQSSQWNQHFTNCALRQLIAKDVERTFPELQFFQRYQTKKILSNVLFFYSRSNPHISYRQGMHELLAPLLFVLETDQKAYQKLKEEDIIRPDRGFSEHDIMTLDTLNDATFLEHDAFALFTQLMMLVSNFYLSDDLTCEDEKSIQATSFGLFKDHLQRTPFSNSNQDDKSSELLRKLNYIQDKLLIEIDPPLNAHLMNLQILSQIYGIRWLRLLFGREFPLLDLLYLWDIIFADHHQSHNIVDYIFVALLVQIRNLLLVSDYCTCIHYLMRYPPISDIHAFVQFVLNLKSSKKYDGPVNIAQSYYARIALASNIQTNVLRPSPPRIGGSPKRLSPKHSSVVKMRPLENMQNKIGRQIVPTHPFQFNNANRRENPPNCLTKSEEHLPSIGSSESGTSNHHLIRANSQENENYLIKGMELLQYQVGQLQTRLNDSNYLKEICAKRILTLTKQLENAENVEERKKKLAELRDIAEHLTRNSVSEQCILQHNNPPRSSTSSTKSEAVEMASEVLGYRPSTPTNAVSRSRLSSKSLNSSNEMIELRFDRKKNF